jgi:hypothetical protein
VAAGATSGVPGYISSISFNPTSMVASSFSAKCKDWKIYMGNTTKSTFSGTTDWVALSGLTKVFDGTVTPSGTGWFTITFPTSFYWDGTSNIVLGIDENTPDYYCTASWQATTRTGTRGILYYSDYTDPDPSSPPTANSTTSTISNIKVGYTPAIACSGTTVGGTCVASATTLCPGASVTLSTTGSTVGTGMTWQWESAPAAIGPWTAISGATSTSLVTTPPGGTTTYYRRQTTCTSTSSSAYSTAVAISVSTAISLPYTETFEGATPGTNIPCAAATPSFTPTTSYAGVDYWKLISGSYAGSGGDNHTPGGSKYVVAGYYIGSYSGNPAGYWFTPGISLSSGKTYRFSYWYRVADYIASYYPAGATFGMYYNTVQSATGVTAIKSDFVYAGKAYAQTSGDFTVPTSGSYFLGVKINNNSYGYYGGGMFDDLNLIELPACSTATAATFATGGKASASPSVICNVPGTTTLSVSGTPAFSGLSFSWEESTTSTFASPTVIGTTATLSRSITAGGTYFYRCKVTCAATGLFAYSDTTKVQTTPITPPYVEDFEGAPIPNNVPCAGFTYSWGSPGYYWSTANAGSPGASVVNHTVGGSKVLLAGTYLGSYGSSADQWWFTPGLALTAGKAYDVSFWFRSAAFSTSYSSYIYKVGLGVGSSQSAFSMMSMGDTTCDVSGTLSTWKEFKRGFVAAATGTQFVGIKINHSNFTYYGTNIDDIGVVQLPPCSAKPAAGKAFASPSTLCSSFATSTITMSGLSAASDLQFQWLESLTGAPGSFTPIAGATLPGYVTTTPATAKWYRCVVTCPLIGAPNVDTSLPVFVRTTPITPPYIEDFETGTAGVNLPCASNTSVWGSPGTYWTLGDGPFSGGAYPAIKNNTPGGSKYLHAGYYIGSYGSGATQFWFTPALALTASKAYSVSYWINGSGYSGGSTMTGVSAGTSQTAAAMTIPAGPDTILNTSTYLQIKRGFISPTTGNYFVGIKVNNLVYCYPGVAIDDIGVQQLPSCSAKPSAGTALCSPTMVCSSGSVTLSLSGLSLASDLTFQWYDVTAGLPGTLIVGATSPSYLTPTLTSTKRYRCVVTCLAIGAPNTDTSSTVVVNVGALNPPYYETFETGTIGVNLPCASYTYSWGSPGYYWTLAGAPFSSSYPAIYNHTPGGSKYLHAGTYIGSYGTGAAQYWFTPAIRFTAGATYEGSYWYNGSGYAGGNTTLGMYLGASQTAAAMTTPLLSDVTGVNTSVYKQIIGRFVAPSTGNFFLGIKVNSTAYSYPGVAIDDIGLMQLPPCNGIPTVGAISSTPGMLCFAGGTVKLDMDLSTVSKVSGLTYTWRYYSDAAKTTLIATSAALTAPVFTTAALTGTTWAECIVKCSLTGDSAVSSTLKIDVGAIEPPYIEDFEKSTPGINVPCASFTYAFGQYYYWNTMGSPMTYGSAPLDNHTFKGSKYLIGGYYLGYYSGAPEMWFTPAIKFTAGKLYQFSYWYQTDGYSGCTYTLASFMGSAQTKAAMTTTLGSSFSATNTLYKQFKFQFNAASTANMYIGIQKTQAGFGYGVAIDDIGLQEVPPCSSPVAAGVLNADPIRICASGGTTVLDLTGTTLATGLTYTWQSKTATGTWSTLVSAAPPYSTDPLVEDTWFRCIVACTASGAKDTSASLLVPVGAYNPPYIEDFESVPAGTKPVCSDATYWGLYDYDGFKVKTDPTYAYAYNNTPGGKTYLAVGYYLGYYGYYTPLTDNNFWFTPGIKLDTKYKYQFSYYYVGASNTVVKVASYYGKSQSVGGMTIPLQKLSNLTGSYQKFDTTIRPASNGIYYFGLQKTNVSLGSYYYTNVGFDDIGLDYAPCDGMPFTGSTNSTQPSGTALCVGTPVQLTHSGATFKLVRGIKHQWQRKPLGGAGPFVWTSIAGATDTVLNSDTLVGYEYRFAVICSNTGDTAFSSSFQIPALPPHPPVAINPTSTPVFYCLGDSVKFSATFFTGAVYDWMLDSVVIPGWKFNDIGATEPGTYMVRVSSAFSPCPGWSNKVKLVVNDPGYSVNITKPSDSIICAGTSLNLSATASKAGLSYQWRKNNVDIPGATSSSYLVTTGGYYRVMAYDGTSTCQAASRNILITVKPNPPAVITIPGGTATACENEGVQLNANTGGFTYEWTRGGSTIFGWSDSIQVIKNSGIYSVKVRSVDGCVSVSSSVTVNILPSPVPFITKSGLVLSSTGVYTAYQWIRNGFDMPNIPVGISTSPSFTLTKNGIYKVRVKDGNGCEGTSNPIEIMEQGLSIGNVGVQTEQIKIYPNPTESTVFIESPVNVLVSVKDVTGKTIYEARETKSVDLSKFADGVYLFSISDKDGVELIKQQRVTKYTKR